MGRMGTAGRTDPEPIRVWLEPGYDHGRFGAWMLDRPGCFTWGIDRAACLASVPSAANRFVLWLTEHGDGSRPPTADAVVVVDEIAAVADGGYERNATFTTDDREVTADELESLIRRLGHAREDLLDLVRRVRAFESAGGSLPVEERHATAIEAGASPGRETDEVLRHIAAAETWLASRLDRTARYAGPGRDGDPVNDLAATRAWAVDRLREVHRRDAQARGVDGKGETWTLAKVCRRFLYHSLDHLEELDRRLARAEHRADRLELRRDGRVDVDALAALLRLVGMRARTADRDRLARMLAGTSEMVSAWDGDRLVGFARLLTDGAFNAYVSTVAVDPRWQGRGLGHRLMRELIGDRDDLRFVLHAREGTVDFYRSLGFESEPLVMVRPRRR